MRISFAAVSSPRNLRACAVTPVASTPYLRASAPAEAWLATLLAPALRGVTGERCDSARFFCFDAADVASRDLEFAAIRVAKAQAPRSSAGARDLVDQLSGGRACHQSPL